MDGSRVVRIEIDDDRNGSVDRWEYYDANRQIEKVGFSRQNDGIEDAWSYARADGTLDRVEISASRDKKVTRIEHFENDAIVRAEEDTDGDGKMDKWETFDSGHLTSVAYDTLHRGMPNRRLIYGPGGSVRVEVDSGGIGQFLVEGGAAIPVPK